MISMGGWDVLASLGMSIKMKTFKILKTNYK